MTDREFELLALERYKARVNEVRDRLVKACREGGLGEKAAVAVRDAVDYYDLRGRAAGSARRRSVSGGWIEYSVRFNPRLMALNEAEFFDRTVPHEFAHIADFAIRGKSDHGRYWKRIMMVFGVVSPERCHEYVGVKKARELRTFPYHCGCSSYSLSSVRVNKMKRTPSLSYRCKLCHEKLVPGKRPTVEIA